MLEKLCGVMIVQTGPGWQRSPPHKDLREGKKYLLAKWKRTTLQLMTPWGFWGCELVGRWLDSKNFHPQWLCKSARAP